MSHEAVKKIWPLFTVFSPQIMDKNKTGCSLSPPSYYEKGSQVVMRGSSLAANQHYHHRCTQGQKCHNTPKIFFKDHVTITLVEI